MRLAAIRPQRRSSRVDIPIEIGAGQTPWDALVDELMIDDDVADVLEDWILEETGLSVHDLDLEVLVGLAERFEAES